MKCQGRPADAATHTRALPLIVLCSALLTVGCQELPPGVLAGSRPDAVETPQAGERVPMAAQRALPNSSDETHATSTALLEQELIDVRSERDALRIQLSESVEKTLAAQAELVEIYRQRALAAEAEADRLRLGVEQAGVEQVAAEPADLN